MINIDNSDFRIAWAKIISHAAVNEAFKAKLQSEPLTVFSEHGFSDTTESEIKEYLNVHLGSALDVIRIQREHQEKAAAASNLYTENIINQRGDGP